MRLYIEKLHLLLSFLRYYARETSCEQSKIEEQVRINFIVFPKRSNVCNIFLFTFETRYLDNLAFIYHIVMYVISQATDKQTDR